MADADTVFYIPFLGQRVSIQMVGLCNYIFKVVMLKTAVMSYQALNLDNQIRLLGANPLIPRTPRIVSIYSV